jgi:hypothetical protein
MDRKYKTLLPAPNSPASQTDSSDQPPVAAKRKRIYVKTACDICRVKKTAVSLESQQHPMKGIPKPQKPDIGVSVMVNALLVPRVRSENLLAHLRDAQQTLTTREATLISNSAAKPIPQV